jgi:FlaA1/EpsC-like NDP-sugar epimerase
LQTVSDHVLGGLQPPRVIVSLDLPMTSGSILAQPFETAAPSAPSNTVHVRRLSRQVSADTVAIGDLSAVVLGGLLPALIYAVIGNVQLDQIVVLQSTLLAGFIAHLCLRFRGMYDTTRMDLFPQQPIELLIAVCCGLVGVLGIGLPLVLRNMHLVVWYSAWISASFTLILLNRMVARMVLAQFAREGRYDQRVAVFGAGQVARRVHDYLSSPLLGVFFSGVYDDRVGQDRLNPEGLTVSGKLDDLIAHCREGKIDRVIIALPPAANERLVGIVEKFESLPVSTHIVTHIASDLLDTNIAHNVSNLGPVGLLDVKKKR